MTNVTEPAATDRLPHLQILIASTRPGRVGAPVGEWVREHAVAHGGFHVTVADLATINLPFLDEPHHPRLHNYIHQHTKDWSALVAAADAFVFVTPEYNYGINAPLKNALDFLALEWRYKPVGFVSYGGISGGTRAVQMTKQVITTLKMTPITEAVAIPFFNQHLDTEGHFQPTPSMETALTGVLDELARVTPALQTLRAPRET